MFFDLSRQKIITEEDFYIYYVLKFNDFFYVSWSSVNNEQVYARKINFCVVRWYQLLLKTIRC